MELFFDLIFVAAVAEVGSPLTAGYSWPGLFRYSFLFILIWWAWIGHTMFSTRFDSDDLIQRALLLLQSFIAAIMAVNAEDALDSRSSAGFGAAYAGMRIVLVLQYWRARRIPETRSLTTRHAVGFGIAAVIWAISALTDTPTRYWLWAAALLIDFATPWISGHHLATVPPDASHFPERFGLFTIILLGEFVAAVMRGIKSHEDWSIPAAATAFAGVAFAFALRWWYFDAAHGAAERHVRSRKQAMLFQLWQYAHLPLFLGIGIAGAGFQRAISEADSRLHGTEAWILCSAVAIVMTALATIAATSDKARGKRTLLEDLLPAIALPSAILGFGAYASLVPSVAVVLILLSACIAQIIMARYTEAPGRLFLDQGNATAIRATPAENSYISSK